MSIQLGLNKPPVVTGAAGAGTGDEMDKLWSSYAAKVSAAKAYEDAGMDIQPLPGFVVKCWLKVDRSAAAKSAASAGGADADADADSDPAAADLDAILNSTNAKVAAAAAAAAGGGAAATTTTSTDGMHALPYDKVDPSQRVKLFINLCSSSYIPAPEITAAAAAAASAAASTADDATQLRIPLSVGSLRLDTANDRSQCVVIDVVVNQTSIEKAKPKFSKSQSTANSKSANPKPAPEQIAAAHFLAGQAMQRIAAKYNLTFLDQLSILQTVKYKGSLPAPVQRIRRAAAAKPALVQARYGVRSGAAAQQRTCSADLCCATASQDISSGQSAGARADTKQQSRITAVATPAPAPALLTGPVRSGCAQPPFTVRIESPAAAATDSSCVESFSDYSIRTAAATATAAGAPLLPTKVLIEVELPKVNGVSEIEVEISESNGDVLISSAASDEPNTQPHNYYLQLHLPFALSTNKSSGHATKFHRQTHKLALTLPVTAVIAARAVATANATASGDEFDAAEGGAIDTTPAPAFVADSLLHPSTKAVPDIALAASKPIRSTAAAAGTAAAASIDWRSLLAFTNPLALQPASASA